MRKSTSESATTSSRPGRLLGPRPRRSRWSGATVGHAAALVVVLSWAAAAHAAGAGSAAPSASAAGDAAEQGGEREAGDTRADADGSRATATFAGGCFWCMEPPFDALDGVLETTSGYTGGTVVNPTYEQVSEGGTGHAEALRVTYDSSRVTYEELLHVFWRNVDPLIRNGQFCDHGDQYRSAIFYHDDEQRRLAEASKQTLETERFRRKLLTEIVPAGAFYPAEDYHQDYYRKNPLRYRFYRYNCGRDARLKQLWGEEAGGKPHVGKAD